MDEKSQLLLAASPQAFDSRNFALMGGFSAVGQVKDQGECNSCVSFAVLAAAQSAVACARRRPATSSMSEQVGDWGCRSIHLQVRVQTHTRCARFVCTKGAVATTQTWALSTWMVAARALVLPPSVPPERTCCPTCAPHVQDFLFCRTLEPGEERTCSSSWSMRAGVQAFIDLTRKNQYPVLEACMPYQPDNLACFYDCQDVEPSLKLGRFSYLQVQTLVDVSFRGNVCIE